MKKEDLLKKWLVDKLTDAELKDFESMDDFHFNTKIVEKAKLFDIPVSESVKSYSDFKKGLSNSSGKIIWLRTNSLLFRIAGVFIITIGLYFLFFFNNLTTIQTLASQKTTFELPDASEVLLNADSQIKFNKRKWNDKRELILKGEAFFKVEKGSKFDVITSNGIVSVLGTQFNVKSRNNYFEVKCFEGIVGIRSNGILKELKKGNTYRIYNNAVMIDSVITNQPEWLHNISSFKAVPLSMVINEFEIQYGIEVEVVKVDVERIFTGSFANDNMEQALISITVPFNLKYKKSGPNKISIYKSEQ
jgi:ferric-dicitrate binding protein FerR (iron transport regulator)